MVGTFCSNMVLGIRNIMDKKEYRRFGGRVGGLVSHSSIWLADDHLLDCKDSFFTERYRRFYFKDIQALVVNKTIESLMTTLLASIFAMGSLWFLSHATKGWFIFWSIVTGFFFIILVVNILKGQSCRTFIQTAVQKEQLSGINRIKEIENLLVIIKPAIQSFQGEIGPQDLEVKYEEYLEKSLKVQAGQSQPIEQDSTLHTMLFLLFTVWSLMIGMVYSFNNGIFHHMILVVYMALVILNVMAVVKQSRINMKPTIKNWAWVSLASLCITTVVGYITLFIVMGELARTYHRFGSYSDPYSQLDFMKYILDHNIGKTVVLVAFPVTFLIGIIGLILSARLKRENKSLPV